jgi:hypothetical protein
MGSISETKEKKMETELGKMSANAIYVMAKNRFRYGRSEKIESYINNAWFLTPVFKHLTGRTPRWGWNSTGWKDAAVVPEDVPVVEKSMAIMREFCGMTEAEVEQLLVSRSTLDAAKYSVGVKGSRLEPGPERELLERCKGKKSRINALLTYCGKWDIMPDNMTEITMVAGFEGGRRGRIGVNFIKKLAENKKKCKDLLSQIMKLEGIGEDEPIKKIMERLG